MTIENIDASCADTGRRLSEIGGKPKDIENSLTKAAGVLEEQGVYAMFLYLFAREDRMGVAELGSLLERFCGVTGVSTIDDTIRGLEKKLRDARQNQTKGKGKQKGQRSEEDALRSKIRKEQGDFFAKIGDLSKELDELLFARDILHMALVYGRYHAKARAAEDRG